MPHQTRATHRIINRTYRRSPRKHSLGIWIDCASRGLRISLRAPCVCTVGHEARFTAWAPRPAPCLGSLFRWMMQCVRHIPECGRGIWYVWRFCAYVTRDEQFLAGVVWGSIYFDDIDETIVWVEGCHWWFVTCGKTHAIDLDYYKVRHFNICY